MSATPMDIDSPVDDVKGKTKESGEKPRFEVKKVKHQLYFLYLCCVD